MKQSNTEPHPFRLKLEILAVTNKTKSSFQRGKEIIYHKNAYFYFDKFYTAVKTSYIPSIPNIKTATMTPIIA